MLLGCCHCGQLTPSSVPSASVPSGSAASYIASVDVSCSPCGVLPKRFQFTSTASMFTFSNVGGTRTDCGGWDQAFTLYYNGTTGSSAAQVFYGAGWNDRCAVWKTNEFALHTNSSPLAARCTDSTTPRWELVVTTTGGVATARLFAWHTGGLVFGVPVEMYVYWSETLTPVSGSNCVMDIDLTGGPVNYSGATTPTYTSNNTIAPSILLQPA